MSAPTTAIESAFSGAISVSIRPRRSTTQIHKQILELCQQEGGAGQTAIQYTLNLCYESMRTALQKLSDEGLIERISVRPAEGAPRIVYRTTNRGMMAAASLRASGLV